MATLEQPVKPVLQAKTVLAANGRIVIPAAIREALGFKPGEILVMAVHDGELRVESFEARLARIQGEIRQLVGTERSLADELIADRREEVRREGERDLASDIEMGRKAALKGSFAG